MYSIHSCAFIGSGNGVNFINNFGYCISLYLEFINLFARIKNDFWSFHSPFLSEPPFTLLADGLAHGIRRKVQSGITAASRASHSGRPGYRAVSYKGFGKLCVILQTGKDPGLL
jgi:hypothetical protein